jgi:predicted nucleotidyltransferase
MPVKSLNSSVIKWPDQKTVHNAVSEWARKVSQDHPTVIRIGYIGSYARGDWGVGSDLDLVTILESSKQPFWRRPLELPLPDLPVPADMLVYTMEEGTPWLSRVRAFLRPSSARSGGCMRVIELPD